MGHLIWQFIVHHNALTLYALLSVEESGIPIPVPGDLVMMFAGYRVHAGFLQWYQALGAGVLATLTGSFILYHIGRQGGRPLLHRYGPYLHLTPSRQERIEHWLTRYGASAVFIGRLIPGMRCGSSFLAGTFEVAYPSFFVATAASAAVWWGAWIFIGSRVGRWVMPVLRERPFALAGFVVMVVFCSGLATYVHFRIAREKQQAQAGKQEPLY